MPKKPPDDGKPPDAPEPSSNGGGQEEFLGIIRGFFQDEILPNLQRYLGEQVEARVAKATEGLGAPQAALDATAVAKEAAALLAPAFTRQVQGVADELAARIDKVAQQRVPGELPATPKARVSVAQGEGGTERAEGGIGGIISAASAVAETLWPMFEKYQMMKLMGTRDLAWAQSIRETNPMMAQMYANIMAPDQFTQMLGMTIPGIAANSLGLGIKIGAGGRGLRDALASNPQAGGAGWPATPSSVSPGYSPGPGPAPSAPGPGTPGPTSGASMTQRPKPKLRPPSSSAKRPPAPAATEPAYTPARSLREAIG